MCQAPYSVCFHGEVLCPVTPQPQAWKYRGSHKHTGLQLAAAVTHKGIIFSFLPVSL